MYTLNPHLTMYLRKALKKSDAHPDLTYYVIVDPDGDYNERTYTITTEEGLETFFANDNPEIIAAYRDGYREY